MATSTVNSLPAPPGSGLCAACRHATAVRSDRGSVFVLCGLSRVDDRFARYPRLPVTRCDGFAPWERRESGE